jgi:predicted glycosyltransferase
MPGVSCVGYYVHHLGVGHERRFRAIASAADDIDFVPISELPLEGGLVLPSDVPDVPPDDPTAGGQLHWAPLHATTATRRLKTIVDWLDSAKPSGVVVDVSVEMVLACRLAGVRTIAVRQHGDRTDAAHRLAFGSAVRLLAPFPAEFETSTDPVTVAKTDHVGFISPPDLPADACPSPVTAEDVVVLWGRGGGHIPGHRLDAIASVTRGRVFCVGGDVWHDSDAPRSDDVIDLGWVEDPRGLLLAGPLVVGSCGNNSVALVASYECPFVALPQERPFDEQVQLAEALEAVGVAAVAPAGDDPAAWRQAIARAECRSKRWARLGAPIDGARAAADVIRRWLT